MKLPAKYPLRRRHSVPADVLALSFPKAGRTWVRYFLGEYIEKRYGAGFSLDFVADESRDKMEASKSATGFHRLGTPGWSGDTNALKVRGGNVSGYQSEMSERLKAEARVPPFTGRLIERLNWRKNP